MAFVVISNYLAMIGIEKILPRLAEIKLCWKNFAYIFYRMIVMYEVAYVLQLRIALFFIPLRKKMEFKSNNR